MSLGLEQIMSMIPARSMGYFATIDGNKPDVRGWQLQFIEGNKFYFCTSTKKDVYRQLKENPNISFYVEAGGYSFRISGAIEMDDSEELNNYVYSKTQEEIKALYPDPKSSGFIAFTLSHGVIKYAKGFGPFTSITF